MEQEAELVAEIRLHLDSPNASLGDVLNGSLALLALGYTALAHDYAARVARKAHEEKRPELLVAAREVLLCGARKEPAQA